MGLSIFIPHNGVNSLEFHRIQLSISPFSAQPFQMSVQTVFGTVWGRLRFV